MQVRWVTSSMIQVFQNWILYFKIREDEGECILSNKIILVE